MNEHEEEVVDSSLCRREESGFKSHHARQLHICKPRTGCSCYQLGDNPSEDCPSHGFGFGYIRCDCGRFCKGN